jgi:DNA-binding XRE family transcriptional regulator
VKKTNEKQKKAQHRKELESLKEEVAKLINLFEQALRSKSREATFVAQPLQMPTTPFQSTCAT